MGKYTDLQTALFSIFDTVAWKAENVKTFPANFLAMNVGNEYIRVSILPNGAGLNVKSTAGIIIIDIFIAAGNGPKRAHLIADKLDAYLSGKVLTVGTSTLQMRISSLQSVGTDSADSSLYRYSYSIPFTLSGVF